MVELLRSIAKPAACAVLLLFQYGCADRRLGDDSNGSTDSSDDPDAPSSSEGTTLQASTQSSPSTSGATTVGDDDTSGWFTTSSEADSTTAVPSIECELLGFPNFSLQGGVFGQWTDGGVDVTCDALSLDEVPDNDFDFYFLRMMCADAQNAGQLDLSIDSSIADRFADLPGTSGLRLSFFHGSISFSTTLSLREPDGTLILLSYAHSDSRPERDPDMIVGRAPWLEGSDAWETWNAPFGEIWLRDIGCIPIDVNSAGSPHKPLAIEFPTDAGPLSAMHHGEDQVQVDGHLFDIIVVDALQRLDATGLPPGHPLLSVRFAIVRAP